MTAAPVRDLFAQPVTLDADNTWGNDGPWAFWHPSKQTERSIGP